jgi:hypothetical protein
MKVRRAFCGRCETSYRDADPNENIAGTAVRLTHKTLKGAFALSAESVASSDAVAQRADRREVKAHERIGLQKWRAGSGGCNT